VARPGTVAAQGLLRADIGKSRDERILNGNFAGWVLFAVGTAVTTAVLLILSTNSSLSLPWICLCAALLAAPILLISLRFTSRGESAARSTRVPFWPPREQMERACWNGLAAISGVLLISLPLLLLLFLTRMPPGNTVWGFLLRVGLTVSTGMAVYFWSQPVSRLLVRRFHGRASQTMLEGFNLRESTRTEPADQPVGLFAALKRHWQSLIVAILAFCVASGLVDFDTKWLDVDLGPRRFRRMARLLETIRGNIGTVRSTAALIGTGSLAWFVWQLFQAVRRQPRR
jgi:hypothetical protein